MKKPLIPICTVTFVVLAMALNGASAHGGAKRELRYEYHLGDASPACDDVKPTDDPIEVEPGPTCRPEAVAGINPMVPVVPGLPIQLQGGGSIAIQGAGELAVSRKGKPRHVDGGGTYAIFGPPIKRDNSGKPDLPGRLLESGSWRAKKLLQFDSYGPGKGSGNKKHIFGEKIFLFGSGIGFQNPSYWCDYLCSKSGNSGAGFQ